jgi:hypothetical protein
MSFVRGMHELTIAHINADVAQAATIRVGENEHIARLEIGGGDLVPSGQLTSFVVGQCHTELSEDKHDKASAIESSGRRTAPPVPTPNVLLREVRHLGAGVRVRTRRIGQGHARADRKQGGARAQDNGTSNPAGKNTQQNQALLAHVCGLVQWTWRVGSRAPAREVRGFINTSNRHVKTIKPLQSCDFRRMLES